MTIYSFDVLLFLNLEPVCCSMSGSNCCFLTCIHVSQESGQVLWYSHLFKNFSQFVMIYTVKTFSVIRSRFFLWNSLAFSMIQQMLAISSLVPLPFLNPAWTSGSSWFTYYWSLPWRIMCNENNCMVVWTFSGIAFLWDWNENWPFPVLWPLLSFHICWYIECSTLTASSFRIWNSSSPPLALFVIMFPKAHLTSHSRMSGSSWVTTPF